SNSEIQDVRAVSLVLEPSHSPNPSLAFRLARFLSSRSQHCRLQPLALPESCPLDSAIADHRSVQRQSRRTARNEGGHARPRPRWFGDIHRMNPQSNVTASTLALSTATMAPIAMKTVPRLAQRRPDSLFAVIFV